MFEVLPEVFFGDVGAVPQLAEVTDPYVALEAHQDGAVDRAHHGDLQTPHSARFLHRYFSIWWMMDNALCFVLNRQLRRIFQ